MKNTITLFATAALLTASAQGRSVPEHVRALYNSIRQQGSCDNELKGGFYSQEQDSKDFGYCADHLDSGILYLQGKNGNLVNMDIDCDGALGEGDGSCDSSQDTQSQTTFKDTIASYGKGIDDLNAYVHSYVVLGNDGSTPGYVTFDPEQYGVEPLSVVAVVCGDKMFYGVWGDTNGDDGPPLVGEVSDSLGRACYGEDVNGNQAHDVNDVLYIAFTGSDAVPGANGATWHAGSFSEFEASLSSLGDSLIARIDGAGSTEPGNPPGSCSWEGHCLGAACSSGDDCDGELICDDGVCAEAS